MDRAKIGQRSRAEPDQGVRTVPVLMVSSLTTVKIVQVSRGVLCRTGRKAQSASRATRTTSAPCHPRKLELGPIHSLQFLASLLACKWPSSGDCATPPNQYFCGSLPHQQPEQMTIERASVEGLLPCIFRKPSMGSLPGRFAEPIDILSCPRPLNKSTASAFLWHHSRGKGSVSTSWSSVSTSHKVWTYM